MRALQGQPLWQLNDKDAGRRAPAHDASGHTWQHPDEALFQITKYGRFASTREGQPSRMPAFRDRLTDEQILAIIAFIKRSWPIGLRASQAMLNPGYAGMPPEASGAAWKFPPTCRETLARYLSLRARRHAGGGRPKALNRSRWEGSGPG